MANQLGMAEQHSIITLWKRGWSHRRIARTLGVSGRRRRCRDRRDSRRQRSFSPELEGVSGYDGGLRSDKGKPPALS